MNVRKLKPGALVELECKHFVSEGLGLSYFSDESQKDIFKPHVFFIWGVLPGERFIARLALVKSKLAHGVLARRDELGSEHAATTFRHEQWALIQASAERMQPRCDIYLRCGGCRMQHMSYERSLQYKLDWLNNQLRHHKVNVPGISLDRAPEAELFHYRNHVQVHINKFGTYGFYEPLSYRTRAFPDHGCLIFNEKAIRGEFPRYPVEVRAARIRQNSNGRPVFTVLNAKDEATARIRYDIDWPRGGATQIEFPVTQFFQVNLKILPRWLDAIAGYFKSVGAAAGRDRSSGHPLGGIAEPVGEETRVLELFSGFGFISRMMKQVFPAEVLAADILTREQVAAVSMERDGQILSADFSANYHRVDLFLPEKISAEFIARVRDFNPGFLLINPPRAGLSEAAWKKLRESALASFKGPIVYSSCNAATMARDLGYLALDGYRVEKICLFDFFPWTHHFETVALLCQG